MVTLAALTGSPRVVEAVTSVQSTLHEMLLAIPVLEANIAHSDIQHARIVRLLQHVGHGRAVDGGGPLGEPALRRRRGPPAASARG